MTKLIIILSTVILILIGLLGFTYKSSRQNRSEAIRWENNYIESSDSVARIQLTLKEFKEQSTAKEDSLLEVLAIKPKQVEKIVYIENEYIKSDTVKLDLVKDLNYVSEVNKTHSNIQIGVKPQNRLFFISSIDCLTITGNLKTEDLNSKLELTSIRYRNDYSYVAYWQRRQWKLLGIKTRLFGKKQGELNVSSKCGKTVVKEIDIIKKK